MLVLAALLVGPPVQSLTFQTRLENVTWQVEGDQFECRLVQPITGFGTGEFVRKAGEQSTFRIRSAVRWFGNGSASLYAAAVPWQPGQADIPLGNVAIRSGDIVFDSSQVQAGRLLGGLLEGRSPLVRHRTVSGDGSLEVRLLPVRFTRAYEDYQACAGKLLPYNFDQLKQVQLVIPSSDVVLDDSVKTRLNAILEYMKVDSSVNRIYLDGHSDNSGDRLTNRELSRRRALAVQQYLMAKGIPAETIVMRFHGERYPLVPNNSKANRLKNRRVTVQLEREPVEAAGKTAEKTNTIAPTAGAPVKAPS
nr:OmpA family protein [Azomonas macrocytogenes]